MLWKNQIFNALGDAGVRSNLNSKDLLELSIPFPPLTEQQRIADFLDRECGKIDGLKADIQAQIDTLEQYKRSVITEAVTHGLNPFVPMKDSGIPWVGQFPTYWTKKKGKYILRYMSKPVKQDEAKATYAPIIKKEMAHIDFNKTAKEICDAVRGFYSWPCAFCFINGKRLKVIKAEVSNLKSSECGVVIKSEGSLVISCKDGSVELVTVQPEGSKVMSAKVMLNGNKIACGTVAE